MDDDDDDDDEDEDEDDDDDDEDDDETDENKSDDWSRSASEGAKPPHRGNVVSTLSFSPPTTFKIADIPAMWCDLGQTLEWHCSSKIGCSHMMWQWQKAGPLRSAMMRVIDQPTPFGTSSTLVMYVSRRTGLTRLAVAIAAS
jgi:hypothetical protein